MRLKVFILKKQIGWRQDLFHVIMGRTTLHSGSMLVPVTKMYGA